MTPSPDGYDTLGNLGEGGPGRRMSDRPKPRYSVVIPVRNEAADVTELARRVGARLDAVGGGFELIFIDDGSTDGTWEKLLQIADPDRVRLIKFRRNFGKAAALMAGFEATRGEIVFTMDGDLQDDPDEIPKFLDKLAAGFDLVTGWKKTRRDPPAKVIPSRIFNYVVRKMTRLELHDMNCGFKCFRGDLARELRIYGELHRYIPALAADQGYRVAEVEVLHHPRLHGRSKYGMSRLFKGFVDLVTVLLTSQYRTRPAHGFGWAALIALGLSMLTGAAAGLLLVGPAWMNTAWMNAVFVALSLKSLFFALAAVILFAAGWTAEVAVAAGLRANPSSQYRIEDRVD